MSLARKHALISGSAWLIISVAFIVIIAGIGVEGFASPAGKQSRVLVASVILPGYLINFALMWWHRRGRKTGEIDERDMAIQKKATEAVTIVMLLTIFLFSIGMYDANVENGTVPVGWFYILAYGTVAFVSLLHPVLTLVIDFTWQNNG